MDKEALVKEIRTVLSDFMKDVCKINMAMLIKDLQSETYTFLLSSYLLDLLTPYDGTKLVAEYFYKNLDKNAFSIISRINIVNTIDPSIQLIMKTMNITNSIVNINNVSFKNNLFNVCIDDGIILESHRG